MDADKAKRIRRRIYCMQRHIQFLEHLATDPTTVDSEVFRRYEIISDLKAQIKDHMGHISNLMDMSNNVQDHLKQAETKVKALRKQQDKLLIEDYIREYLELNRKLTREEQC